MPNTRTTVDDFFWFRFYPRDLRNDPGWRRCSYAAKGLWVDMLCAMWEEETRGVLPGAFRDVVRLVGGEAQEIMPLLYELEQYGVFSHGADVDDSLDAKAIVNRRMWRDWKVKKARSEAARKAGLSPHKSRGPVPKNREEKTGRDTDEIRIGYETATKRPRNR